MDTITIQAQDEAGRVYFLGAVKPPKTAKREKDWETRVKRLYDEWFGGFDTDNGEGPNCDSEFIDWLVKEKKFSEADAIIVTIG